MSNTQIAALYEVEGLDPNTIADALGYSVEAVKMALMSGSAKFRRDQKKDDSLFTEDDRKAASEIMKSLMYSEESDNIKFKSARYVLDEMAGRHDVEHKKDMGFNVNIINVHMAKAEEAIKAALAKPINKPRELVAVEAE